jgi:predicted nucleotidyltransferase
MSTVLLDASSIAAAAHLLRSMGATEVFVFGSAVKGGLRPGSDVDLAVTGLPANLYFSAVSKASSLLGREVDLVHLDDPTPLVAYLIQTGELVRVG